MRKDRGDRNKEMRYLLNFHNHERGEERDFCGVIYSRSSCAGASTLNYAPALIYSQQNK